MILGHVLDHQWQESIAWGQLATFSCIGYQCHDVPSALKPCHNKIQNLAI